MNKSCNNCDWLNDEKAKCKKTYLSGNLTELCDMWQPKPTDKGQCTEKDWSKAQETLQYGIDECNKLLDKPDSQLTDTDGTDCIKQMISDEAFEEWYEKNGSNVLNTSWCRDLVAWKVKAALHIVFKAGQEDRDKEVEDLKGQTNKALIMTTNYMTENRQLIKQLEKRQHLQSKLDRAVELIKGYYPDTDYAEGVDHEDFIKVKKRLNKQAEQFLKDCKGE